MKLRGGRRYFNRLQRDANAILRRVHEERTGTLWHHHFDFRGFGERSARLRLAHRRLLIETLTQAQAVLVSSQPFGQVFAQLAAPERSRHDALYCVAGAAGQVAPTYRYPSVEWRGSPPVHVREVVPDRAWRVGRLVYGEHEYWVIADPRDPGLPV